MNSKIEENIEEFLVFEERSNLSSYHYNDFKPWLLMRVGIFEEIFNIKNLSIGFTSGQVYRPLEKKIKLYFSYFLNLGREIFSLLNFFKKVDILVINNDSKKKIIDKEETTKLVWSICESIQSDLKIGVVNTQSIVLSSPRFNCINISGLLSIFSRLGFLFISKKKWNEIKEFFNNAIYSFYGIELNWNRIYGTIFCRQILFLLFFDFYCKFKRPKIIIFSDNGQMSSVNKIAHSHNIPTIDYQHAVLSDSYIIYKHSQSLVENYKEYLSKYYFAWGSFRLSNYKSNYICKVVGNAYFERELERFSEIKNDQDFLIIVSDGAYTRDDLSRLALCLSSKFPYKTIYYKLRPEEYESWKNYYPSEFSERSNMLVIDRDDLDLYYYLSKSNFTIGTNSTVLLEASPISKVIVLKRGWFFEMNDYIDSGLFMSADSNEEIIEIIEEDRVLQSSINYQDIFTSGSLQLIGDSLKEIADKPTSYRNSK